MRTEGHVFLRGALLVGLLVGVFGELDEAVDEIDLDFLEGLAIILVAKSIQLPDGLAQLRVEHVLHAVLGPEWGKEYLPRMSFEMSAQRLPWRACRATSSLSSSAVHFSFLIPPLRWLW